MKLDPDKFNSVASGVQSVVVSLAVIVGGAWTLATFNMLGEINRSKAEMQDLEHRTYRYAALVVNIGTSQISNQDDNSRIAEIYIDIENNGSRNTVLNIESMGLIISSANFGPDGKYLTGESRQIPHEFPEVDNDATSYISVRAGSTTKLSYLVEFDNAGVYSLTFLAEVSDDEREIDIDAGAREMERVVWGDRKFVRID